jgi:hypothetical protein
MALDETSPVEVGEYTADGRQGETESRRQFSDADRLAADLFERGDVPRAERSGRGWRRTILPAAQSPDHSGKQLHQA